MKPGQMGTNRVLTPVLEPVCWLARSLLCDWQKTRTQRGGLNMEQELEKQVRGVVDRLPEAHRNRGVEGGVGAVIGGVTGSILGGPIGSAVGAALGGAVGVLVGEEVRKDR